MLDRLAGNMPDVPVNTMDQYHPDNFCDPGSAGYRAQYAEIARRPHRREVQDAYRYAAPLGLTFETVTFERATPERYALMPGI